MRRFSSYSAAGVIALSAFTLFISSCSSDQSASAPAKATLDLVKERGVLHCGVTSGLPGFSQPDTNNVWSGVDVDVCRGVAAAVLGDANKVKYFPLTAKDRFTALSSGEIDILSRNTTWTMSRDTGLGLSFAGVNYYDGQGFMVNKKLNAKSTKDLNGATFCIQSGTTTELNLADYAKAIGIQVTPITFDTSEQTRDGFQDGRCDVLTSDQSQLYSLRTGLNDPESAVVLPEVISKEPLGPVVRSGDEPWLKIVRWTLNVMIEAEEYGLTKGNAAQLAADANANPTVQRLLGTGDNDFGKAIGLDKEWSKRIIEQVGNYGESFDANIGENTPLKIARGQNALWSKGGLMYAPPLR